MARATTLASTVTAYRIRDRRFQPGSEIRHIMFKTRLIEQAVRQVAIGNLVHHSVLDLIEFIDSRFNNGPRQEPVGQARRN